MTTSSCIKLYIPEMCCGAETALIEKAFKGSDLVKDIRFDTLARTALFTPANENVTAAMLITIIDSVGMQANEIRETILSEMAIRIERMQTDADVTQVLELVGLDCAVDKINRVVRMLTYAVRRKTVETMVGSGRARELLDAHWQIYELLRTKNTDGLEDLIRATYFLNIVNN